MKQFFILLSVAVAFVLISCSEPRLNKFSDPVFRKMADLQDRRSVDSLSFFLNHENAAYRTAAALAFGSVQDSVSATALTTHLLEDKDPEVRRAAAFALGQTGTYVAVNALLPSLQDSDHQLVRQVLEALGKTIRKQDITVLHTYQPSDSLTEEGLAWSFYRLGLRDMADTVIEKRALLLLDPKYNAPTRLGAAHFFARTKLIGHGYDDALIRSAQKDAAAEVRIAAAQALRKMTKEKVLASVTSIFASEQDARVRIGATRALASFPLRETLPLLKKALEDKNVNVAIAASETIKTTATAETTVMIEALLPAKNWRVQANLYDAILSFDASEKRREQVKKSYTASTNDYEKAALLVAFGKTKDYGFLAAELFKNKTQVIKSSAAQALVSIDNPTLDMATKRILADLYEKAMRDGDGAVIALVAATLADSTLGYREIIKDYRFLAETKQRLSLPRDYETLHPLEEAIAYFDKRKKPAPPKNQFNHPIDWKLVATISKDQEVIIKTTKGDITLRLFVEEATGSTANFVDLLNKKYFDGKFVHRVVPNFVIQAGCNRGDGYGSEDYSIRSEFSPRKYTTGSVGMASAGKDTEGTQWFITHSPTPHLDGRYSVFAETINGMDVVDAIEVGDKIISVTLKP